MVVGNYFQSQRASVLLKKQGQFLQWHMERLKVRPITIVKCSIISNKCQPSEILVVVFSKISSVKKDENEKLMR